MIKDILLKFSVPSHLKGTSHSEIWWCANSEAQVPFMSWGFLNVIVMNSLYSFSSTWTEMWFPYIRKNSCDCIPVISLNRWLTLHVREIYYCRWHRWGAPCCLAWELVVGFPGINSEHVIGLVQRDMLKPAAQRNKPTQVCIREISKGLFPDLAPTLAQESWRWRHSP